VTKNYPEVASRAASLRLSDAKRNELAELLRQLVYPHSANYETWLARSHERVSTVFPAEFHDSLAAMRRHPDAPGVTIIHNMPIDTPLPPTPLDGKRSESKLTNISESVLGGIGAALGEPFSFRLEKESLIHDVVPVRTATKALTNEGSELDLGYHTENAAIARRQRWLLLLGLRADHDGIAKTPVADIRDAALHLSDTAKECLTKPLFRLRVPYIFDRCVPETKRFTEPAPIIEGGWSHPRLRVALYGNMTVAETPAARDALNELELALHHVRREVRIKPGDLVILDNYLVSHGRSAFTPRFDGTDRWLQRVHVAESLWDFRGLQSENLRLLDAPQSA
jgi:L-asparagine oxygenase